MQIIPITQIEIGNDRIRQDFDEDHIQNLVDSILTKGNLHPPVVTNDNYLIAGENRFRAIQKIAKMGKAYRVDDTLVPPGSIGITRISDLSPDLMLEAELEENIIRKPLTWQEETKAHAALHSLRISQRGAYSHSSKSGHTIKDTVTEIVGHENPTTPEYKNVSDSLLLAEFLDDPLIAACADKAQAIKMIKKQDQIFSRARKAERLKLEEIHHTFLHLDCFNEDFIDKYKGTFDVIIADPPYGKDMHKQSPSDGDKHKYDDSKENFYNIIAKLPEYLDVMTKPNAHAYIFCDITRFRDLYFEFVVSSWIPWERPIIWTKGNIGYAGDYAYGPRPTYEAILYIRKGDKQTITLSPDTINIPQSTRTIHPAGKPSDLYLNLLRRSAEPGSMVFDPFGGSGPIFPAAEAHQCTAVATEELEEYYNIGLETLHSIKGEKK